MTTIRIPPPGPALFRHSEYPITPCPKPRQTQADKWKKRPAVLRYRAFADECRLHRIQLPESDVHVTFVLPMPESWSEKKKTEMDGKPHQQKPDRSNLMKALEDALYQDDAKLWDSRSSKIWGREGKIIIETGQKRV